MKTKFGLLNNKDMFTHTRKPNVNVWKKLDVVRAECIQSPNDEDLGKVKRLTAGTDVYRYIRKVH